MILDEDVCYRAVSSRDARFDGWFYTGVTSTGIYCRPSCPAITPRRENVRFFTTAAGAQQTGFRACLRCRPDAVPGSPEWNYRSDLVARAMRLIADGVVDVAGVEGLARRLGYTSRHVHRALTDELGVGALALARAQRAQTARTLIEVTDLPFTDVAYAAGFASIRQFNDTIQEVFAHSPSRLRSRASGVSRSTNSTEWSRFAPKTAKSWSSSTGRTGGSTTPITLRLPYRAPLAAAQLWNFLAGRAIAGIEATHGDTYRRTITLPHGPAIIALHQPLDKTATTVNCTLHLTELRDLTTAVRRCRRLLDLDADPHAVSQTLGADPALADVVAASPGLRVPGACDPAEYAVRAVIGQQISVAAARTVTVRIASRYGTPLEHPDGELTHTFPTPQALAGADPSDLPMTAARKRTLISLCTALSDGTVNFDVASDPTDVMAELVRLPGIGPWTAGYIAMRGLGAPDVFLETDLGVLRGARALGLPDQPRQLLVHAERWRPWRSYAVLHLWQATTTIDKENPQ